MILPWMPLLSTPILAWFHTNRAKSQVLKDSKFADARYLRQMLLEVFTALDKAQRKFGFHRALALTHSPGLRLSACGSAQVHLDCGLTAPQPGLCGRVSFR